MKYILIIFLDFCLSKTKTYYLNKLAKYRKLSL